jgi:hypothetical protein
MAWEFLQDGRRTANAEVRGIELGLGEDFFIAQHADRGKNWPDVAGTGCGAGTVRRYADGAG